jgi:hypothetical protein
MRLPSTQLPGFGVKLESKQATIWVQDATLLALRGCRCLEGCSSALHVLV